ncbi:MAG: tungstate ABC transporter substrate-binding protein WtpA [Bacteroidales bacterium]|nr:tungstate ABC transporter substrate-binding protein WtpA [Bacteroidales bacterium]
MRMIARLTILAALLSTTFSCGNRKKAAVSEADGEISGELIIFHAGSLSMPIKAISDSFMAKYPNVKILAESSGSIDAARKITELKRDCDIIASADYTVIDKLLVPDYVADNVKFATNRMSIVYTEKSAYGNEINSENWPEILLRDDVHVGRSDPDADPCGYRTILTLRLEKQRMEKMKGEGREIALPGKKYLAFPENLLSKDNRFIRPKEVDLLALLDVRAVDYIFLYRSVAVQHGLKFVELSPETDLSNPEMNNIYRNATVQVRGSSPSEKMEIMGEAMVYSAAMLKNAPNKRAAQAFMEYLLSPDGGGKIMEKMGQPPVIK